MIDRVHGNATLLDVIVNSNTIIARDASHSKDDVNILKSPIEAGSKGVSSKSSSTICVILLTQIANQTQSRSFCNVYMSLLLVNK